MDGILLGSLAAAVMGSTALNIWLFLRSQAHRVEQSAAQALFESRQAAQSVEAIQLRVNTWKLELDNAQEAVMDGLARAESKRNRAETAERAAERRAVAQGHAAVNPELPRSREEILAPYRRAMSRGEIQ